MDSSFLLFIINSAVLVINIDPVFKIGKTVFFIESNMVGCKINSFVSLIYCGSVGGVKNLLAISMSSVFW